MSEFDFEGVFNEDYLYFYEGILDAERTREDVEKIVELLELAPTARRSSTAPAGTAASRTRSRSAAFT